MATQQPDMSLKAKRKGIFPHSFRKFVIGLTLILFVIAGVVWLWQVWGNVSNILAVIFTVAGVIIGTLTLWPSSTSNEAQAPVSSQLAPFQINNNINLVQSTFTQQTPSSTTITNNVQGNEPDAQSATPNSKRQAQEQQFSSDLPPVHPSVLFAHTPSQSIERNESFQPDRDDLLELLTNCLPSVFSRVVFFLRVPDGILSGDGTAQAVRATELIKWAEHGGPGLQKLYEDYQRAEYGKKKSK